MDNGISTIFRQAELTRRAARREILLRQLTNETLLIREGLGEDDYEIHLWAVRELRKGHLRMEKELLPGYWQRLWAAIWGR